MDSLQIIFQSMAVSMGIAMHNANTNQRSGQLIATACLSVCCKQILESPGKS
ncbi:killing trait domain-containing protein [Pedobacter psychrotolerans]|uniref:Killing trait domain-containing protein n=1 Tax=Pedobacter psychrotolerans TaxID=1843235 RepID=A0A4R2H9Q9_9SPHI|nr:RebB family R body protein [Pedobacter psychrotolerans]TCO23827.1 killing trait domain-containing protein [Pedobacter psychrotolerans]